MLNTTNTNGNSTLAVNGTDAFSFLAHELSEVMGRQMNFAPSDPYNFGGTYYPEDLFDYTAAGVRSFSSGAAHRYFSDNGGVTNIFIFIGIRYESHDKSRSVICAFLKIDM